MLLWGLRRVLVSQRSITASASSDWLALGAPGVVSVNQITVVSLGALLIGARCRAAKVWCESCMSNSGCRCWRWSIAGALSLPRKTWPLVSAARTALGSPLLLGAGCSGSTLASMLLGLD